MLYVKFIQNWNDSQLTKVDDVYPNENVQKSTLVFSDGLKLIDINYDAESYISDDFFLRQPREAKITLLRDSDDWLRDNFLYHNEDEINHVLYLDEDGEIIEYEGVDPGWSLQEEIANVVVDSKEVLIQQFSKIIVEIWEKRPSSSGHGWTHIKKFTGLIDKSQTTSTHRQVVLNCIDFTGLIKLFGDQLIKIISGLEDDDYKFIVSHTTVNELIDKIKDFTKLEIEYSNSINDYLSSGDSVTDIGILDLVTDVVIPDINNIGTIHGDYVEGSAVIYSSEQIFADIVNDVFIVFTAYTYDSLYYYNDGTQGGEISETTTHLIVLYKTISPTLYISSFLEVHYDLYTIDNISGSLIGSAISAESALNTFKNYLNNDSVFLIDESLYLYNLISGTEYSFHNVIQSRYKLAIPIYADTYTYMKLLKTILFLNILTIYADGNGVINVINKNFTEQESGASTTINERDILDGYDLGAVEKDELEMSDALEPIWYDVETEGELYNNLDNVMKEELSDLFILRFPIEFNGSIKYKSVNQETINHLAIGSKLKFFDRYWIVISSQLNKTSFSTKIKAYGLADYVLTYGGIATADTYFDDNSAFNADKAFDTYEITAWWSKDVSGDHWLKYDYGNGNSKVIKKYIMDSRFPTYPTTWKFQGSTDDSTWIDLDDVSDFNAYDNIYIKELSNLDSYRYYRMLVTDTAPGSGNSVFIRELELYR